MGDGAQTVGVISKQVHDARLVAVCHLCGVSHILTFNVRDFTRFATLPPGLELDTFAGEAWKRKGKVTRRERFLGEMDAVIPSMRCPATVIAGK